MIKHKIGHLFLLILLLVYLPGQSLAKGKKMEKIKLVAPNLKGNVSLEEAVKKRRSRRSFKNKSLTVQQLSQILWSAQGISGSGGFKRTVPSAGALYPIELYVILGEKTNGDYPAGIYLYTPKEHTILKTIDGDLRKQLSMAALGQSFIAEAPLVLVIVANYSKTTNTYGKRGVRYVDMEAGHLGQNVHLQAEALGLGTCMVGAFNDENVTKVIGVPKDLVPIYIMPIGYPR